MVGLVEMASFGRVAGCSDEHAGGEADEERNECHADQQPGEHPRRPVGAGLRRWHGLIRVTLAQDISREGDVGWGDEHLTWTGGKELRHIEAGRATDDRAHVRIA